jgi:hypothetical protein
MVFLIMDSIDISEEVKMLTVITTHLSRGFMKMKSISKMIKADGMKFKVNGTTDMTLGFMLCKQNDMMMKV